MRSLTRRTSTMLSFGPSPRLIGRGLLYTGIPLTVLGTAYKAFPLVADYFNRNVCTAPAEETTAESLADMAPEEIYASGYSDGQYSYPVRSVDTSCVSPDQHRDLMFGIPTSISIGIFAALFVLGIIYMVALAHQYRITTNTVQSFSRKRVVGYDLMKEMTTTLLWALGLVAAWFALVLVVGFVETFFSMLSDMTSSNDTDMS